MPARAYFRAVCSANNTGVRAGYISLPPRSVKCTRKRLQNACDFEFAISSYTSTDIQEGDDAKDENTYGSPRSFQSSI